MPNMPNAVREHVIKRWTRSSQWPKVRKQYLKENPNCVVCGKKASAVHHIVPFHVDPGRELDPDNLIGFCGHQHHLLVGHLMWWKAWNPSVEEDSSVWTTKIKERKVKCRKS